MSAIAIAKNIWVLCMGVIVAAILIGLIAAGISGGGVSEEGCRKIQWQGGACEELARERVEDTLHNYE